MQIIYQLTEKKYMRSIMSLVSKSKPNQIVPVKLVKTLMLAECTTMCGERLNSGCASRRSSYYTDSHKNPDRVYSDTHCIPYSSTDIPLHSTANFIPYSISHHHHYHPHPPQPYPYPPSKHPSKHPTKHPTKPTKNKPHRPTPYPHPQPDPMPHPKPIPMPYPYPYPKDDPYPYPYPYPYPKDDPYPYPYPYPYPMPYPLYPL